MTVVVRCGRSEHEIVSRLLVLAALLPGCAGTPCERGPSVNWGSLRMAGVSGHPVTTVTGAMTAVAQRYTNGQGGTHGIGDYSDTSCAYDTEPLQGTLIVERDNGDPVTVEPEAALPGTYQATLFYAQHFTWTLHGNDEETVVKEWALPPLFTVTASETATTVTVSWSPPDVFDDGFRSDLEVQSPSGVRVFLGYVSGGSTAFPAAQFAEAGTYSISLTRGDLSPGTPEYVSLAISTTFTRP